MKVGNGSSDCDIVKYYKNGETGIVTDSIEKMRSICALQTDNIYLFSGEYMNRPLVSYSEMLSNAMELQKKINLKDELMDRWDINQKDGFLFMSGVQQSYLAVLDLLYRLPEGSILLLDEPFAKLDSCLRKQLLEIMTQIKGVQIILTAGSRYDFQGYCNKIELDCADVYEFFERPEFDYRRFFERDIERFIQDTEKEKDTQAEVKVVKYALDMEINEAESRNIEFKEVKGNNLCNTISDVTEIYINAFLNSQTTGRGIIKWGVTDSGIIKGVKLTKKDKDIIDRKISEKVGQMKPYVSQDIVKIVYENIADKEQILEDLYVVEIYVEPWKENLLFATSKNEVYIKTERGKKKLDSYEIQKELKSRLKKTLLQT